MMLGLERESVRLYEQAHRLRESPLQEQGGSTTMWRMRPVEISAQYAAYIAHELSRRHAADSASRLAAVVAGAQVDLNPHQVEAALFAFRSPLSQGAVLADEVGLGKTIEAGLVLAQRWAERRRRILIIVPANLRKQWHQELTEKFFLPCDVIEAKSYSTAARQGSIAPFESSRILICSYHFARSKALDIQRVAWDLVVLDEAHHVRNVYKPTNVIANTLRTALQGRPKLLLTATPLQNSLLELYGLVSFVDAHVFGDEKSFRAEYSQLDSESTFVDLKRRLAPICHRTLRRQVTAYVAYTKRLPIVQEFSPEEAEDRLYELVSAYLQRENLVALPSSQRSLMTLVLRKLLASSTFAIAGALASISGRLKRQIARQVGATAVEELREDFEALDSIAEDVDEPPLETLTADQVVAMQAEIADLDEFARLAGSIQHNAKGRALLTALDVAFERAAQLGAPRKAIIFTESRRTQDYLLRVLSDSPHAEGVVLFNGSNSDARSKEIYSTWLAKHQGTDRVTGSRSADMRSALVDFFRDQGRIMIATEAGAEGINLQFCSLVVNYDLPWNPQRIEQRIGRCHRYGQKHDVVVVNFLNKKNEADQRVYRLLAEKFNLFEGVFGASDEILGAIESGVDFEKRIAGIYQTCRRHEDIRAAFDQLQLELSFEISETMAHTRRELLENFDDEVREKLRVCDQDSRAQLDRFERLLMLLTRYELKEHAEFLTDSSFQLNHSPFDGDIPIGLYELPRRSGEAHLYRHGHPLADAVIESVRERALPTAMLELTYSEHEGKVSALEPFIGASGWMEFSVLSMKSAAEAEDQLVLAAVTDSGHALESELVPRLLALPGRPLGSTATEPPPELHAERERQLDQLRNAALLRNVRFLEAESEKLDGWADDLKAGLEREIKELDREIKEARRAAKAAQLLQDKISGQRHVKQLEGTRTEKRKKLFVAQDEIDGRREALLAEMESMLAAEEHIGKVFTVRWTMR